MTRIRFHRKLDDLKERLLVMAGMAEQAIQRAVEAYRVRDISLCDLVVRSEISINSFEREIDQMALDLLAMEQPMAIDLRFILAVIKINGDLERVGDQSMSIAIRTQELLAYPAVELPVDIASMGEYASRMIRSAIQALLDADAQFAEAVVVMDDEIDRMNGVARGELMKVMEGQPEVSLQALNAIIIARALERIADHATNISRDVIFWIRGADIRHQVSTAID
jgi:phosphate transport system protein